MKKILLLSNMYPSKRYPHYGIFVRNTEKILNENDYEVIKVVMEKEDRNFLKFWSYFIYFFKSLYMLLFKTNDYVYIHYPSLSGVPVILSNFFKKQNIIINIHGNDLVPECKKDSIFVRCTLRLASLATKVIVPSEYFREIIVKKNPDLSDKVVVFPSGGVDTKTFNKIDRDISISKLGLKKDRHYIGYIGRIETSKGWNIFLDMINNIDDTDIEFIIVGDGSERTEYDKKVKDLKLTDRIIKYNLLSQRDINYIFNVLDIFVFPTFRKSESLGLVGLEAMSTNTILLAANNYGPTSYVVDEVNGFLFESQNVESLVKKVSEIMNMSELEKSLIHSNAEKTLQDFSIDKMSDQLVSIFEGANR